MMVGIAEDPEIVLSDEEVFTSADAFESKSSLVLVKGIVSH